jgi:polar amino acid transport system substrate-binding protein
MRRLIPSILIGIILSFIGCSDQGEEVTSLSMLEGGKTFAVPTGTVADKFVLDRFPDAKVTYYNTVLDCAIAVKDGKADAAVYDKPVLQNIAGKNEGIIVLPELIEDDKYGFAVQMDNRDLKKVMDDVLNELKADNTYDDMMKRWFPVKGEPKPMPDIQFTGNNGVLRFGTSAVTEPMSFVDANRNVVGFDIEFASYIALKLDKKLEIVDMEFGAMLPALISGKVDMIGAGLSITEERAKKVLYSESYYPSGIAVVVKDNSRQTYADDTKFKNEDDIKNKRVGVLLGSVHDSYASKNYPEAKILQFQNVSDLLIALESDKVDAVFYDHVSLKEILSEYDEIGILAADVFTVPIAAGFNKNNVKLREDFNAFLQAIKSDGTYDDMVERWMNKGTAVMPEITTPNIKGKLNVGVVNDLGMPFTIIQNGELAGFDIELSKRFAAYLGKEFVPVNAQFASMLAAVSTNRIDIITCSMMVTEERKKQINFSEPYYESGVSVVAKKKHMYFTGEGDGSRKEVSFIESISSSFYNNIILEDRYLIIVYGLITTIVISIFSALLGTVFGGVICFMRMSKRKLLAYLARFYISLLRGTPVLVLLMIIYYVVFASVNINPVVVAVIAFGLNFAAYVSEMFRTSIESIDRGQSEAGIANGFSKIQTFLYIIMPQALRRVLPVYKGEFISLVKMTSIVGYIAVQDLTKASDIIRSRTFDAFFPLIMAAVIYLALAWLLTWALSYVEVSVNPKRKQISLKEVRVGA